MQKHLPKKIPPELFVKSWKLFTENGRQYWRYLPTQELRSVFKKKRLQEEEKLKVLSQAFVYDKHKLHHACDLAFRKSKKIRYQTKLRHRPLSKKSSNKNSDRLTNLITDSLVKGWDYYTSLQTQEGHFPGDYGGPLFLISNLALLSFTTNFDLGKPQATLMKRYIFNHQNPDGGWGLHIEGESIMFTTVVNYITLRLWGEEPSKLEDARKWIRRNGGAGDVPSWGKYFLAMMGLYEWEGIDSLSPESWLFPRSFIFSPYRFWCHARMVYLPLSYLYGTRFKPSKGQLSMPIISQLKKEIYLENYDNISWIKLRRRCCPRDEYFPVSKRFKLLSTVLNLYEKIHFSFFRKRALLTISKYVDSEDIRTDFINIGPISKVYNALVVYHRLQNDPSNPKLQQSWKRHCERIQDYLWVAEDGMKMNGYNGSQFWDTLFTGRALLALPRYLKKYYRKPMKEIQRFLNNHRLDEGGWPFSTRQHSWPISDCSAEGVIYSLAFHRRGDIDDYSRLTKSVNFLLGLQNPDGGWPTYEVQGGPAWLECLNSSMIFGDIMVDYSYVECTSANIQALEQFHSLYPNYRNKEVSRALDRGRQFIISKQKPDGSWYGSWGICFTYGIFFAVKGLIGLDNPASRKALINSAKFLLKNRNSDGSWGESYLSSSKKIYHSTSGQAVHTAWAILSLLPLIEKGIYDDSLILDKLRAVVRKGIGFLINIQKSDGDWPQSRITGVFNQNCMITYINYRNIFPLWALGAFLDRSSKFS